MDPRPMTLSSPWEPFSTKVTIAFLLPVQLTRNSKPAQLALRCSFQLSPISVASPIFLILETNSLLPYSSALGSPLLFSTIPLFFKDGRLVEELPEEAWLSLCSINITIYSISIVPGGLFVMSYTTRPAPGTSLVILVEIAPSTLWGIGEKFAVIPSRLPTARTTIVYL